MEEEKYLLEFFGTECPHCSNMEPLVKKLEQETGVKLQRYEVWHNEENAQLMDSYDQGACGGVPFFYNTKTHQTICGEVEYAELKDWALGKAD